MAYQSANKASTRRRKVSLENSFENESSSDSSIRSGNSSPSLEHVSSSKNPSRQMPLLKHQTTPDMELIENGMRNMSVFDALIPSSQANEKKEKSTESNLTYADTDDLVLSSSLHGGQRVAEQSQPTADSDVHRYMARREMTPLQERVNAITVIPGAFFCLLYLLSGSWLNHTMILNAASDPMETTVDLNRCITSSWFPHLHAGPPLPVVAAAFGIICHAPFSFIYHWSYAHRLPSGFARSNHWSRRWDQAMIHFCSAFMAYATSGQLNFFFANLLFNADSFYRQFKHKVRPGRNQTRIAISIVAYTIPILGRGDWELFGKLWGVLSLSFILFGFYPIGGWSHAAFHLVLFFVPPLLMNAALDLPASQAQLKVAAQCALYTRGFE